MAYKNLNIPATLIHTVNGKKYTLDGNLLSINESTKMCSMQFGDEQFDNVSLSEVYLNEAFLDDIKAAGRKVADKAARLWTRIKDVVKTVAGFILPVDENGEEIAEFANIPANIATVKLPDAVRFAPGNATLEVCHEMGVDAEQQYDIDTVFGDAEAEEREAIEAYWTRVMQDYGESDRTLGESVRYVNEHFYHESLASKKLNESVASLHSLNPDLYGPEKDAEGLADIVLSSLMHQLNPVSEEDARAVLIWGAPGIGKTAIIKKAAKMMRKEYGMNFDTTVVCCGGIKVDDFELPDTIKNAFGDKQAVSIPKTWLPVFNHNGLSDDEIAEMDRYYNSGAFLKRLKSEGMMDAKDRFELGKAKGDDEFDGGIIFFDEFARIRNLKTMDTMLTLCGDRKYIDMELASQWVMVAAANRLTDDMKREDDKDFWETWDQAKFQRFYAYTFVPTKADWLKWAREVDDQGYQNVDELIVKFIEKAPEGVWYDAIDMGSRDDYFDKSNSKEDKKFKDAVNNIGSDLSVEDMKVIGTYISNPGKSMLTLDKRSWSGRTWDAMIAKKMLSYLKNELFYGQPEKYEACFAETTRTREIDGGLHTEEYKVKNLSMQNLSKQLDLIPDEKWFRWTAGKYKDMDKNQQLRKTDRLGFFVTYVGQLIKETTGEDNLPAKEWNKQLKTGSVMDETNIRFLWERGKFKLALDQRDDNIYYPTMGEYSNSASTSWKADPTTVDEVCQQIWDAFPTYCTDFMLGKDIKNMELALNKNNVATEAMIKKWDDVYTIKMINSVNGKPKNISLLFNNCSEERKLQNAFLLEYSEIARRLAYIAMYFTKLSIQIGSNTPLVYLLGDAFDHRNDSEKTMKSWCLTRWQNNAAFSEFIKKHMDCMPWVPAQTILESASEIGEE